MNLAQAAPSRRMTLDVVLMLASDRYRGLIECLMRRGQEPARVAWIVVRLGRLHAIVDFAGARDALVIPLDVWPAGGAQ